MRSRIFEPFFTTKDEGSGTGVGLAIVHNIISAHGGTLRVGTCPELGGALFELHLPIDRPDGAGIESSVAAHEELTDAPQPLQVLVVDDDLDVVETIAELLSFKNMRVDVTSNADTAIEKMASADYDVVLSDLRMPDTDGPAYFRMAKERWPGIEKRFGFVTGDSLNAAAAQFLREADVPVAEKPVTRENLLSLVAAVRAQCSE